MNNHRQKKRMARTMEPPKKRMSDKETSQGCEKQTGNTEKSNNHKNAKIK